MNLNWLVIIEVSHLITKWYAHGKQCSCQEKALPHVSLGSTFRILGLHTIAI
jgi:hypothetical protein